MRSLFYLLVAAFAVGCQPSDTREAHAQNASTPLPACEWCGTGEAPDGLGWTTTIASPDEPGDRLVVTGTVYEAAGVTPAPGVTLYFYHTNNDGVYPKRGDETGNGRRHGYLRSWIRTDERGRYRIATIRPAPYPGRADPAHIHITVQPPGAEEYWIDSIVFDDDPLLTPARRAALDDRGGSGITSLRRDEQGVWHGTRDIVLVE